MSFEFPDDRYFNSHLVPWQCLIITGCLNEHCKSLSPPPRDSTLRGTKQVMVVVVYTTPAKPCSFIEEHPLLSTQSDILLAVFKTSDGKVLILSSSFAPFSIYQRGVASNLRGGGGQIGKKAMTPHWGSIILFRSSQQLPCLSLVFLS